MTMTQFRSISMSTGFRRHLAGKHAGPIVVVCNWVDLRGSVQFSSARAL